MKVFALAAVASAYEIKWYNYDEANAGGSSWYAARNFCKSEGGQLCTYDVICPDQNRIPDPIFPDYNSTMETVWIPTGGQGFNTITQIGFSWAWGGSTCNINMGDREDLNDNDFGGYGLCCLFDAPLNQWQFCDWDDEVCSGQTLNDYQHQLVLDNANDYVRFNVKFDSAPFYISFGSADDVSSDGIKYEIYFLDNPKKIVTRSGPVTSGEAKREKQTWLAGNFTEDWLPNFQRHGVNIEIQDGKIHLYAVAWDFKIHTLSDTRIKRDELTHMYVTQNQRDWFKPGPHYTNVDMKVYEKYPREVTERLAKLRSNFDIVLDQFGNNRASYAIPDAKKTRFRNKYDSYVQLLLNKHEKLRTKTGCVYPESWKEHHEEDDERMVADDPCFAIRQLSKGVQRWANTFTYQCRRENNNFAERIWRGVKRLRNHIGLNYCEIFSCA